MVVSLPGHKGQNPPLAGLSLAFRFAIRELRGGLKGFYVFLACIALGAMTIAGVNSISRAMIDGISAEGQTILGGDVSFSLMHRETNDAETEFLKSLGTVSNVATMRPVERVNTRALSRSPGPVTVPVTGRQLAGTEISISPSAVAQRPTG